MLACLKEEAFLIHVYFNFLQCKKISFSLLLFYLKTSWNIIVLELHDFINAHVSTTFSIILNFIYGREKYTRPKFHLEGIFGHWKQLQ